MRTHRIAVINGDGVGPELVDAALDVLRTIELRDGGFQLESDAVDAGAQHYVTTGRNISDDGLTTCRAADAVLKGPVGLPGIVGPEGTEAGLLGGTLRGGLDLYANLRPVRLWPGVRAAIRVAGEIDYAIVRENTEGLYASRGGGVTNAWAASDVLLMTRPGVERIVRFAFELARERAAARGGTESGRVTCVDKANVLRSFAFFRGIFDEVRAEYPEIEADHMHTDAAAQALVVEPDRFDVIVTENFVGDLLSDLGGGTVGGIGMCASANLGIGTAVFEPVHGSAPALAGTDRANPLAQILAGAMMLDHLGEHTAGEAIREAVSDVLGSGAVEIGVDGCPIGGTRHTVAAIRGRLAP